MQLFELEPRRFAVQLAEGRTRGTVSVYVSERSTRPSADGPLWSHTEFEELGFDEAVDVIAAYVAVAAWGEHAAPPSPA